MKSKTKARDEKFEFRISKAEKKVLAAAARAAGLPLGTWARTRLLVTARAALTFAGVPDDGGAK